MSEKIVGWIAIGLIFSAVGYIYKYNPLTPPQLRVLIISVLILGAGINVAARRCARRTVIKRRRMYKDLWKRDAHSLNKPEADSVVLLGRIKGVRIMAAIMLVGSLVVLYFDQSLFALVLAFGQLYLGLSLLLIARRLDQVLLPDSERDLPVSPPREAGNAFLVGINMTAFHDFILPQRALPFWSPEEAKKWLIRCGFTPMQKGKWKAGREALRFLDSDEITSLESCPPG